MFFYYVIAMIVAIIAIVIGVILGDYGPWYFSWFLGTGFMVLLATAGGILYEAQEDADATSGDAAENLTGVISKAHVSGRNS